MGPTAVQLLVNAEGIISDAALDSELAEGPTLVAIQQVNNETGVIQPLDAIYARIREAGSLLLADCAQGAGKLPLPDADFITVSAHKLGGPPGIGALLVRDLSTLSASGGQERGYRRGTENVPAAAGFAAALASRAFANHRERLIALRRYLEEAIVSEGGYLISGGSPRSPFIGAYAMPGTASAAQLVQLDLAGISVSAGSACSSGSLKASRVHEAMGLAPDIAGSTIRVSFGPNTSQADIDRFLAEWRRIKQRAAAA
jgi:cysteine desulfurase